MSTALALRIATLIVVGAGLVALYLGSFIEIPGLVLIGAAVVWGWWREPIRHRINAVPGLHPTLVTLAGLASLIDIVYLATTVLDGLVRLLTFLLLYRIYFRRSLRDIRNAGFLAFFMLVAAAPMSIGVGYLFVFLAFLFAGTWMLMLNHVLSESERAEVGGSTVALGRDLLRLSLVGWTATLTITAVLFFIIPRIGQASLPRRSAANRMVSGFSEHVELGSFGTIEMDDTVVMRVGVPAGEPVERLMNLKWRGLAFDRFDGRMWTASRTRERTLRPMAGHFEVDPLRSGGPFLTQEIYLEPIGSEVIFGATRMVRVALRRDTLRVDDTGSVSAPLASTRQHYVVQSQLEEPASDATAATLQPWQSLTGAEAARYLELPPISPRLRALALEVTAGSRGPREAARRLTAYLSRELRYTRVLERRTTLDSLDEFLFVRRAGNCEYFAAALTVMLRTVGVPARVVNGFQQGEWNPYGHYFMVRLRDAHSWVEAHVGSGWITLDPSPRGDLDVFPAPTRIGLFFDALQVRWYRYVVNWSLQDQVGAAFTAHRTIRGWRQRIGRVGDWSVSPEAWARLGAALAGVVALVTLLVWRRGRPSAPPRPTARMPRFYARALRALARRGLRPEPGETAREFCARVGQTRPVCLPPLRRLTEAYERVRFGAVPMNAEGAAGIDGSLAELRDVSRGGPRRPPPMPPPGGVLRGA